MALIDLACTRCHRMAPTALTLRLTVTDPAAVTTHRTWRFCPDCLAQLGLLHGSDLAILSAIGLETIWDRAAASHTRDDHALAVAVASRGWAGILADLAADPPDSSDRASPVPAPIPLAPPNRPDPRP